VNSIRIILDGFATIGSVILAFGNPVFFLITAVGLSNLIRNITEGERSTASEASS